MVWRCSNHLVLLQITLDGSPHCLLLLQLGPGARHLLLELLCLRLVRAQPLHLPAQLHVLQGERASLPYVQGLCVLGYLEFRMEAGLGGCI